MKHYSDIVPADLSPVIRELMHTRRAWQLTREDVAERLDIGVLYLRDLEVGRKTPSWQLLIRWTEVMGFELTLKPKGGA